MSNPFLRAYEFEKRYNLERLRHTLEQAEAALKEFRPETIDFTKSTLEMICKVVLDERGVSYLKGGGGKFLDVAPLVKEALKALGCQDEQFRNHIGGLAHSLAEQRNKESIAGHGLEGDKAFIGKQGITLFMMTFSTIMEAIMGLLEAETPALMTTKMTFDAAEERLGLGPLNRNLDTSASVEYSAEDGRLFIDGKELRPSEILYQFDRAAYQQGIDVAEDRMREVMIELIESELSDNRFDNFFPGHYGYEFPEIWIETIRRGDGCFIATGSVSTSARLGSSREEDAIDVPYDSAFTAEFVLDDDPEASLDQIELKCLELDVNDWFEHEPSPDGHR